MRRVLALTRAECLHIVRDRATLAQVLVVPVVQLLVLSHAATFEVRHSALWVVDLDRTGSSRGLVSHLASSPYFDVVGTTPSLDAASDAMLAGTAAIAVVVPRGFETSLTRGRRTVVELSVNADMGSAAGIVHAYASSIIGRYAVERAGPARAAPAIEVRERSRFNPAKDYRIYMVPGILVALVTIIGTVLTAQNVAREKEIGTLEQLNVTPITRGQFIAGKMLPFLVLGLFDLALGLVVGVTVFGLPVRGSLLLLFGVATIYLLVALGLGLWISSLVDTQQQAMFVAFFLTNIYLLMSGLLTPIDSMAPWVQTLSQLNPVRHFVTVTRAILLEGAGPGDLWRPLLGLIGLALVVLTIAVRSHRKRTA